MGATIAWETGTDYQASTDYKVRIEKVEDGQTNYLKLKKEPCWIGCDGFERIRAPKYELTQDSPQKGPTMHPAFEVIGLLAVILMGLALVMGVIHLVSIILTMSEQVEMVRGWELRRQWKEKEAKRKAKKLAKREVQP